VIDSDGQGNCEGEARDVCKLQDFTFVESETGCASNCDCDGKRECIDGWCSGIARGCMVIEESAFPLRAEMGKKTVKSLVDNEYNYHLFTDNQMNFELAEEFCA
jgi:hypothetical protein